MSTDSLFLMRSSWAIDRMRQAGMNETIIAMIVTEIRSAAISNEFMRVDLLLKANPPNHMHNKDMEAEIAKWCPISPTTPDQT